MTLNHLLMALTWTHSDVATTAFREWRKHSPPWASKLCVPPSEYLTCAGWCLDEHDHPRDLYSQQCFLLVNKEEDAAPLIRAHVEADGSCSSCNTRLYWLFDFSQSALDFELIGHVEAPRKVLACLHCAAYGPVYAKYSPAGSSELILAAEAGDPDEVWDFSGKARALSYLNIPTFAAADTLTLGDATTLGGLPMWHQDAEYPRCIECGNYMKFLAQHDDSALGQEGIYYAFYCGNCRVSAVTYQQT